MARDITDRKKIEAAIKRQAALIDLSPDAIIVRKVDGTITFWSKGAEKLYGWTKKEALGKRTHDLFATKLSRPFDDVMAELKAKKSWSGELFHRAKDGREIFVQSWWLAEQTERGEIKSILESNVDMTARRKAKNEIDRAKKKLEENAIMLKEYASQMEKLAEQRAHQLKSAERLAAIGQTAGMVGHDIRNPLQAITSDMYLIAEELKELRDNEAKQVILESVESVNQNLSYIDKIVSDLQDYTRPLTPHLQDANLVEIIEGTLLTIIVPKGIEVITEVKENTKSLRTDVAYMRRILTNLMTNAVQAMQEEGTLKVTSHRKDDAIVITVEDTGVGIPDEVRAKMFTPLFTTKSKGQGLGLAVVKRLVDALNGTITFHSTKGKGTRFTVTLPQTK